MIYVRESVGTDAPAIEEVRRASWWASYAGLIEETHLERATSRQRRLKQPPDWRRTLVAVAEEHPAVVGYASYGPERAVASPQSETLTHAGVAGEVGEVYAIYVTPAWWSTGAGRALMVAALTGLADAGYQRVVLWVLAGNGRARRFYERAGFAADGASNTLGDLGGVPEVRYGRPLAAKLARLAAADAARENRPADTRKI